MNTLKFFLFLLTLSVAIPAAAEVEGQCSDTAGNYCNLIGKKSIYDLVMKTTVRIDGASAHGSGTIIGKDTDKYLVATAAHVVSGISQAQANNYSVMTHDMKEHRISSISLHKSKDLAFITFSAQEKYPLAPIGEPADNVMGGRLAISGFPLLNAGGAEQSELCNTKEYSIGCWTRFGNISREKAQSLELPSVISSQKDKARIEGLWRLTADKSRIGKASDGCRLYTYSSRSSRPDGYNISYDCFSYPGMSGGGVWQELDGKLIGVHGLGLGATLRNTNPSATYKVGVNMGIAIHPSIVDDTVNWADKTSRRRDSDVAGLIQKTYSLLEEQHDNSDSLGKRRAASALFDDAIRLASNPMLKFAISINKANSFLFIGDDNAALKAFEDAYERRTNILASARSGKLKLSDTDRAFWDRVDSAFLVSSMGIMRSKRLFGDALETYKLFSSKVDGLRRQGDYDGTSTYELIYSKLNYIGILMSLGKDWWKGDYYTSRTSSMSAYSEGIVAESLGPTTLEGPIYDLGALWRLGHWVKAATLSKTYDPSDSFGQTMTSRKLRICRHLAAATIGSYYSDPLGDYIDESISSGAKAYCLGSAGTKFLDRIDIIPPLVVNAI